MAAKKDLQCTGCELWFTTRKTVLPNHENRSGTGRCTGSGRNPKQTRDPK